MFLVFQRRHFSDFIVIIYVSRELELKLFYSIIVHCYQKVTPQFINSACFKRSSLQRLTIYRSICRGKKVKVSGCFWLEAICKISFVSLNFIKQTISPWPNIDQCSTAGFCQQFSLIDDEICTNIQSKISLLFVYLLGFGSMVNGFSHLHNLPAVQIVM